MESDRPHSQNKGKEVKMGANEDKIEGVDVWGVEGILSYGLNFPCGADIRSSAKREKDISEVREHLLWRGGVTACEERFQHSPALKFSHDLCKIQVLVPGDGELFINIHKAKWQEASYNINTGQRHTCPLLLIGGVSSPSESCSKIPKAKRRKWADWYNEICSIRYSECHVSWPGLQLAVIWPWAHIIGSLGLFLILKNIWFWGLFWKHLFFFSDQMIWK